MVVVAETGVRSIFGNINHDFQFGHGITTTRQLLTRHGNRKIDWLNCVQLILTILLYLVI